MTQNQFAARKDHSRSNSPHLGAESLEDRIALDASGIAGNPCIPDLDLSAIPAQTATIDQLYTIDLFASGAVATDEDGNGNPIGGIRLQLDPDDNPAGVTLTPEGLLQWTPTANDVGMAEIVIIAIDSGTPPLADAEVLVIEVPEPAPNQTPDLAAIADQAVGAGEEVEITLTAADPDGDNLTFLLDPDQAVRDGVVIEDTGNGTAVLRFTPGQELAGQTIPFSVLVVDDGDPPASDNETFELTVNAVTATDETFDAVEGQVLTVEAANGVLANDTDANGGTLRSTIAVEPTNGTVVLGEDGSFSYTPDAGFAGTDSFTYTVANETGQSAMATATIEVNAVPVAAADTFSTNEDETLSVIPSEGLLINDSDADGDDLRAVLVESTQSGTLTLEDNGAINFVPEADFVGDVTFTYLVTDGVNESAPATVTIQVLEVSDPPVAAADAYTVAEDAVLTVDAATGLLANDTDLEGDSLVTTVMNLPANGTLELQTDGSFIYTPNADFHGEDTFVYCLTDGTTPVEGTVTITVEPVNDAPTTEADAYSTNDGQTITVDAAAGLLANDSDVDGDTLTVSLVNNVQNGTLTLNPDGSFEYTADGSNADGVDSFSYIASDGQLDSEPTVVGLAVVAANRAPVG